MREIKFRGKDINGRWFHGLVAVSQGYSNQPKAGTFISNSAGGPWAYQIRPETLGQYTGLNDRYGREIYEGDIVQSEHREHNDWKVKQEVKFHNGCFMVGDFSRIEVIGNIHDNPELLESVQ